MSTYYEPKLLVGNYLSEVFKVGVHFEGDRYQLQEHLECEGMFHIEDCDWVGFEIEEDLVELSLNIQTMNKINKKAKEFKKITGVRAKIKACIFSY